MIADSISPEALLARWLGDLADQVTPALYAEPIRMPYDRLASVDGWAVWLGHPPVPDGLSLLPAPEALLWDEPATAVATGLLVAADYAVRRGARDTASAREILLRESPVAFVVPDGIRGRGADVLTSAETSGAPVIEQRVESMADLGVVASPFGRRSKAHSVSLGRLHDPAMSFQSRVPRRTIGDNASSSFVVHDDPERDGVTVSGTMSERYAIEVGLLAPIMAPSTISEIERLTASIPSFLDGVTSYLEEDALEIGWQEGSEPEPEVIGEAIRVWLKALADATVVDVRIAFAPRAASTPELNALHARAAEFRRRRSMQSA